MHFLRTGRKFCAGRSVQLFFTGRKRAKEKRAAAVVAPLSIYCVKVAGLYAVNHIFSTASAVSSPHASIIAGLFTDLL